MAGEPRGSTFVNIRDRIKELKRIPANELRPSPHNWRTHPKAQLDALRGILAEVGYAGAAIGRELPDGTVELIDGHARAEVSGTAPVPVLVLDVTEDEAKKILATFDPLGAMAGSDAQKLDELLRGVQTGSESLAAMLDELAQDNDLVPGEESSGGEDVIPAQYQILLEFASEGEQAEALERLTSEGYSCRSLIS
jgi:hypothetical protein